MDESYDIIINKLKKQLQEKDKEIEELRAKIIYLYKILEDVDRRMDEITEKTLFHHSSHTKRLIAPSLKEYKKAIQTHRKG